jgi:hypothetical protein
MRKVTEVSVFEDNVYAVCDDGSLWRLDGNARWHELPPIPDPPPEQTATQGTTSGTATQTQ